MGERKDSRRDRRVVGCLAALALLGATRLGIGQTVLTPPGYEKRHGEKWAAAPGGYAEGHYQFFDGMLKGQGSRTLTGVAYRLYYYDTLYTNFGVGKSWSDVELRVGDARTRSVTFASNWHTAPTLVFKGSVTWPTYQGLPKTDPAPFDRAFPFRTKWLYSGDREILLDYVFRGGTMANGAAWSGNKIHFSQRLDSAALATPSIPRHGAKTYFGNFTNRGCRDPQFLHPKYAWTDLALRVYAKETGDPSTSNLLVGQVDSYYTAKNALVVHALGYVGQRTGTLWPLSYCNRLHLDLQFPVQYFARRTDSVDGHATTDLGKIPFRAEFQGQQVWSQAMWHSSSAGFLALTRACRTTVPTQPPSEYPRHCMYYWDAVRTSGTGPYRQDYLNPILRYSYE